METTTTTIYGPRARKEGLMASTTLHSETAETSCRAFAAEFGHLPNVQAAIRYAEAGTLRWSDVERVLRSALATGLKAVA